MRTYQLLRGRFVCWRWGFWLRIGGHGLHITHDKPLFSERYGFRRCFRVLGWKFERLKP